MSNSLNARLDIKKSYATLKAVEGGDITIFLNQVRALDTKTQLQWVASALQKEVYNLRGEIMRRQEVEDNKLDAERDSKDRVEAIIELRKTIHAGRSWFSLFWEWLILIPIGKRDEYQPETFENTSNDVQEEEALVSLESGSDNKGTFGTLETLEDDNQRGEGNQEFESEDEILHREAPEHQLVEGPDGKPVSSRQDDR